MQEGKIWVASHEGVYLIKMVGDVRLTLCVPFDRFIKTMFVVDDYTSIIFDLTEAESIDSTTLGLMAKIALRADAKKQLRPAIISDSKGINRLLESMGFDDIFDIMDSIPVAISGDVCLEAKELDEQTVKYKVLEAHKVLMSLNQKNAEAFSDLVETLESKK